MNPYLAAEGPPIGYQGGFEPHVTIKESEDRAQQGTGAGEEFSVPLEQRSPSRSGSKPNKASVSPTPREASRSTSLGVVSQGSGPRVANETVTVRMTEPQYEAMQARFQDHENNKRLTSMLREQAEEGRERLQQTRDATSREQEANYKHEDFLRSETRQLKEQALQDTAEKTRQQREDNLQAKTNAKTKKREHSQDLQRAYSEELNTVKDDKRLVQLARSNTRSYGASKVREERDATLSKAQEKARRTVQRQTRPMVTVDVRREGWYGHFTPSSESF